MRPLNAHEARPRAILDVQGQQRRLVTKSEAKFSGAQVMRHPMMTCKEEEEVQRWIKK